MLSALLSREKLKLFYDAMVQMGKDIVSFLTWAAEPEMEERKLVRLLFKYVSIGWVLKTYILSRTFCNADGI